MQKKRPLVLPYMHKVTHILKKVSNRHDVPVVSSVPNMLSKLYALISSHKAKLLCEKNHVRPASKHHIVGIVYRILLSCGELYIGQIRRCVNDHPKELALSTKNVVGSHPPPHHASRGRAPLSGDTRVTGREKNH